MATVELIATAPMGLEALVAKEVRDLGYTDVTVDNGSVTFRADEAAICRANLWLRTADRVLVKMGEFPATTFEDLFQGTRALPWDEWIPANGNFHINGRSHKSQLTSVPAAQGVVEKAIVEKLKQKYHLEWFPKTGALYSIEVSLLKDVALLTMDTTGHGLHKRGYRKLTAEAPIKETLAAALITLAKWHPERPLWDPMCGSGTIPIEAALIAHNIAPGIHRQFSAEAWDRVGADRWETARDEALDLADYDRKVEITGTDVDAEVLSLAGYHVRKSGLAKSITLRRQPLKDLKTESKYGYLITNPPYGERLGEREEVEALYREMGRVCQALPEWSVFVITAHKGFERYYGKAADKKRKLYNGRIECDLYQYLGKYHARPVPYEEPQK